MYYNITQSLKRRLILELKDSFSQHPLYRDIVPFIQNKHSFEERPQFGIVVKGSSANKVALSSDNFVGVVMSHVMLAYVGQPSFPIEWVKEDLRAIRANHDRMPTWPGVYYIEILRAPTTDGQPGKFVVDPLLTQTDEAVLILSSGIAQEVQLQQVPIQRTLRLWENRTILLKEGVDYTVDYQDGSIQLMGHYGPQSRITADYRYAGESLLGPDGEGIDFYWNVSDTTTLPGVVIAFGKRAEVGQKVAVVVYQDRVDAAKAYGGKFEVSFDMDVIARDPMQMEEIADLAVMYLWSQKKEALEFEGIEIMDISIGGESEEIADETGENFFYQASLSVQFRADWEVHVPMPLTISRVSQAPQLVANQVYFATAPVLVGRNDDFERIG